jgi:hypothetical protein
LFYIFSPLQENEVSKGFKEKKLKKKKTFFGHFFLTVVEVAGLEP